MKRILFIIHYSLLIALCTHGVQGASWWDQETICKINPAQCYVSMGAGFNNQLWDSIGKCWGMKLICPDALVAASGQPIALEKRKIETNTGIREDYDTGILGDDGDCFGARKTSGGGYATVNGSQVKIWCDGILSNATESVSGGEITTGVQPTCAALAADGYVSVLNGGCWGKSYPASQYYIECGAGETPLRIIALNGTNDYGATGTAMTPDAAQNLMQTMFETSQVKRKERFK
ncbi:MAG: hypothetical protein LBO08_00850 [Rickettsiales bacterium]|jgi:hypothetical protein|nr:hypothetical protein [Rickettsiales bacterium]